MAFIRVKKRKNSKGEEVSYGYIVENKWLRGGVPRQKVKTYLGRVYPMDMDTDKKVMFEEYFGKSPSKYCKGKDKRELVNSLVELELIRHGFEKSEGELVKDGISVNLARRRISKGKIKGCIGMHDGVLSGHALRKLHSFYVTGEEDAYQLAKTLVESGLKVEKELFIELYQKMKKIYK